MAYFPLISLSARNLERQHLDLFKLKPNVEKGSEPEQLQAKAPAAAESHPLLNETSLFFEGLEDATRKTISVASQPKVKVLTLDQELEGIEVRTVQATWGLAVIKANLQSAQGRLTRISATADRVLQATSVTDLEYITNFFLSADESALLLYKKLGELRDEIAALESELRVDSRREISPIDQRRDELLQHLADVTSEDQALISKLADGHQDLVQICNKVAELIAELHLPAPMVPITDLNLFEAIALVENFVYSTISGSRPRTSRCVSPVIEDPGAQRFFSSWTTPQHRRVRTFLDAQDLSRALKEEMNLSEQ